MDFMAVNKVEKEFTFHQLTHKANNNVQAVEVPNVDDLKKRMHETEEWLCCVDGYRNSKQ